MLLLKYKGVPHEKISENTINNLNKMLEKDYTVVKALTDKLEEYQYLASTFPDEFIWSLSDHKQDNMANVLDDNWSSNKTYAITGDADILDGILTAISAAMQANAREPYLSKYLNFKDKVHIVMDDELAGLSNNANLVQEILEKTKKLGNDELLAEINNSYKNYNKVQKLFNVAYAISKALEYK